MSEIPAVPEPLEAALTGADDRLRLNDWLPPQNGIAPQIRIGRRWISALWALPIGAAALILLIAIAQSLRELAGVKAFIKHYPGIAQAAPSVDSGFPWWLQLQHFVNMFFMLFIIRSGIQILANHPRLYWKRDCTPGTDWFRFQRPLPEGRVWTSKDDSVTIPAWLGLPGVRHSLGLARWWHFSVNLLWVINGVLFYVLLSSADQWRRLIPLTWGVFPAALSTAIQYASLNFPVDHSWTRYNGLQQLSYFVTVFVAASVLIATGLMQSPAISNKLGWFGKVFNRQAMRSVHFAQAYAMACPRSSEAGAKPTARSCPTIKVSSRATRLAAGHGLIWTTRPEKRVARAGGRSTAVWTMKGTRRPTRTSTKAEQSPSTKFTSKIAASTTSFERKVMASSQLAAGPTTFPPASATASARSKAMNDSSSATRTDT